MFGDQVSFNSSIPPSISPSLANSANPSENTPLLLDKSVFHKSATQERGGGRAPFLSRIKEIPKNCLEVFRDEQWMSVAVSFFGVTLSSFEIIGNPLTPYVPYLNILSSPFYLYHAIKISKDRFRMMVYAAQTSRIADMFFWMSRGTEMLGTTISNITKPFSSGFTLGGLTAHHIGVGIIFTFILPIILIAFGTIGGFSRGWALARTYQVLKEFNQETNREAENKPLACLTNTLEYLLGSKIEQTNPKIYELETRRFNENHFTSDQRKEAIQKRVQNLMDREIQPMRSFIQQMGSPSIEGIASQLLKQLQTKAIDESDEINECSLLLEEIQGLCQKLILGATSELSLVDETLNIYGRILNQIEGGTELYEEVREKRAELLRIKKEILKEESEIVGMVRSEIHRKLCYHAFFISAALITLIAGVLLLTPYLHAFGYGLVITTGVMNILYVLFDKYVSHESFYKMDRYLQNVLERNPPAA